LSFQQICPKEESVKGIHGLTEGCLGEGVARNQDQIPTWLNGGDKRSQSLAKQSFCTVSLDRISDRSPGSHSEAGSIQLILQEN
jgi:hypothetical protein